MPFEPWPKGTISFINRIPGLGKVYRIRPDLDGISRKCTAIKLKGLILHQFKGGLNFGIYEP
jgi:hypothetical protein